MPVGAVELAHHVHQMFESGPAMEPSWIPGHAFGLGGHVGDTSRTCVTPRQLA